MTVESRIDANEEWFVGDDRVLRFPVVSGDTAGIASWTTELQVYARNASDADPPLLAVPGTGVVGVAPDPAYVEASVSGDQTLALGPGIYQLVLRRTDSGSRVVLWLGPAEIRSVSGTGAGVVSTGELKDYMSGIGLDADQAEAAQDILDGLQQQLERYCQRPMVRREVTETLWPDEYGRLWPTATPVVSISVPTGLAVQGNSIVGVSYGPLAGPIAGGAVSVTYVGGVDGKNEPDVRLAILRAAAREVDARHSDVVAVNDLSERPAQPIDRRDYGFTDVELAQFDRFRRRTVV